MLSKELRFSSTNNYLRGKMNTFYFCYESYEYYSTSCGEYSLRRHTACGAVLIVRVFRAQHAFYAEK
jgi:hypothetical protein